MTFTMPSHELVGVGYQLRFRDHRTFEVNELCTHCRQPMADGGAPLPGEGKGRLASGERVGSARACASCWSLFHQIAATPGFIPISFGGPVIAYRMDEADQCHHGVSLFADCPLCDVEIEGAEEIID